MNYQQLISSQLWEYAESQHGDSKLTLDREGQPDGVRPPVLHKDHAEQNIMTPPFAENSELLRQTFLAEIKQHKWFRSMKSSQALAISLFSNLQNAHQLGILQKVINADREYPFSGITDGERTLKMEYEVNKMVLNESDRAPTSVDAFISGKPSYYIECKFTETEIGACSMPIAKLEKKAKKSVQSSDLNKKTRKRLPALCNGDYADSSKDGFRCPLTKKEIKYWELMPDYFDLQRDTDYMPCPIRHNYQLVRNCLAAGETGGRVILVYDGRNPSFKDGGDGMLAFQSCKNFLKPKKRDMLQRASWQQINVALKNNKKTQWLAKALTNKYGF